MNYPIFGAVVNQIEACLAGRSINVEPFRVWNEEKINAMGLEIGLDLSDQSNIVKKLLINLDWDKYREAGLAMQLPGMEKHPLLKNSFFAQKKLSPYIDVEAAWYFDENLLYNKLESPVGNRRMEAASHWMEFINKELKNLHADGNLITRWHMEIEGDHDGRYVTDMSLISYLQYHLDDFTSLNDVHVYMEENMVKLLQRTGTIICIALKTIEKAA